MVEMRADPEPDRDGVGAIDVRVPRNSGASTNSRAALGLPAHTGDVVVSPDVVRASYEAAILAPLGPLDAQELLELDDPIARLEQLGEFLGHEIEALQFRLSID